jgi:hypothetical protein
MRDMVVFETLSEALRLIADSEAKVVHHGRTAGCG